jgi:hypothetical protein
VELYLHGTVALMADGDEAVGFRLQPLCPLCPIDRRLVDSQRRFHYRETNSEPSVIQPIT